jgi:hypothetical protein
LFDFNIGKANINRYISFDFSPVFHKSIAKKIRRGRSNKLTRSEIRISGGIPSTVSDLRWFSDESMINDEKKLSLSNRNHNLIENILCLLRNRNCL